MHVVHVSSLDLNLLVVLDALLRERSVTRAAKRVGLSQSATSHALARLRAQFSDPLLIRSGSVLLLTERARRLGPMLDEALRGLELALAPEAPFEPATSKRNFRFATGDYAQFVLFPPLVAHLGAEAPGVSTWAVDAGSASVQELLAQEDMDFALVPDMVARKLRGMRHIALFQERFVCVVRRDHPRVRARLSLKTFVELRHAFVAPRGTQGGIVDDALAKLGHTRHVALAVPHFLVAPHAVAHSDLVITLAERVARAFAEHLPLKILTPPLELPSFSMCLAWHPRHDDDAGHRWMRQTIAALPPCTAPRVHSSPKRA